MVQHSQKIPASEEKATTSSLHSSPGLQAGEGKTEFKSSEVAYQSLVLVSKSKRGREKCWKRSQI